jgi:hypothetical protein
VLLLLVLLFNVLELFAGVGQDDDCSCNLFAKLVKLFIALLDLLVKCLVLNLELFEVD